MIIEINKEGYVDLQAPIYMTSEQKLKFIKGMMDLFGAVKFPEVKELDKEMGVIERHPQKWTPEELVYLLSDKSHEEIGVILKREPFSVKRKRGVWLTPFYNWATKHNYVKKGHIDRIKEVVEAYESRTI